MAANEKPIFATGTYALTGGRLVVSPGDRIDQRAQDYEIRAALEQGIATDSPSDAKRAGDAERERQADVKRQIDTRSEKRGSSAE